MQHSPLPQHYQEHWQFDRFAYAAPRFSTAEEWPACQIDIFEHQDGSDPYYTVVATQLHDYCSLSITNGYEALATHVVKHVLRVPADAELLWIEHYRRRIGHAETFH